MSRPSPHSASASRALVPDGWDLFPGLVSGFGNRRAGAPGHTRLLRRQVHGRDIVDAEEVAVADHGDAGDGYRRLDADADAIVARRPGTVVGVRTADCVPILLVAPRQQWTAAVHAGWRGTIAEIARAAVELANAAGIPAASLHAALGPSIGPCCYEVSQDLARDFAAAGHPVLGPSSGGQPRLDLRSINARILASAGMAPGQIRFCGPCTRCASDLYHSYRAEPGCEGRQISWIGWEDRTPTPDR